MFSTTLELLGLAALVAGAYVLAGLGVCLLAGGVALLFLGYVTDDAGVARSLVRVLTAARIRGR